MKEIQAQHLVNNKSGNVVDDGNMKDRANSKFRKYRKYIVSFSTGIQMLGLYSGKSLADPLRTTIQHEIKECNEKYEEDMATAVLEYLDETERMIANIMGDCSELYRNCTGKVLTLMNILACPSKEGDFREQMVGIVFVKERIVASSLAFIISEFVKIYPEKIGHIKVDWAVGGTSSKAYKMPAAQKMIENNQARDKLKIKLDKFRRGEINLMVATEVLEEGLDITKCNLVIRFDDVPNFRAFVQSKGRARAREESIGLHSRYIILAENSRENLEKLKKDLRDYKNLENSAIDLCHGSSGTEEEDKDDSDDDAYYANPNDQVNSARITKNSAVTIINSFVQNIPTDRYTILAPYFQCRKMPNPNQSGPDVEYRSVLHMPHKTPYSGIPFYGPRCSEATRAKQKVAILACKRLHKDGLLGNDLLPKRKKFDSSEESSDDDMSNKKRGTKSFKEYYPVSLASQFDFDYEAKNFYLYRINTELVEKALDTRNPPYVPELHSAKMGILVSQELPPIFLSTNHFYSLSGKLSTAFENCGTFYLSTHEKYEILAFHDYVFEKVIGCKNSWTWPDLDSKGAMIIPINAQKMIDFNQITKVVSYRHQNTSKIKSTPNRFIYNANDYINTVVTPNHKQPEEHYFVEEVMKNTNPNTILDGNTNITFEKYYKDKYDSMVTSLEQELLRVSGADHRHFMYSKVANKKTEKTRSVIRDQIFMPELVDVEPLLASLWREAQLIPFLMERLTHLSR
jgi:endoribonuclease Dicer